jgi:glycosyltransferase involved in cell wall biosynthesis
MAAEIIDETQGAQNQPAISVIVPVRNDPANLESCLEALAGSHHAAYEVIVVDDASTDDTAEVARRSGARLLRQEGRQGPAAARNRGAASANHEFLFFLDADVLIRPETLTQVAEKFLEDPRVDAFFGSYDAEPGAPNLVSQYRNLLHHHVHQISNEEASTFWSGCGAIRKSVFFDVGGFDSGYGTASIEDIELGSRLHRAGYRIALVKNIQVKHLKRWTLLNMIDCDIRKRGIPWTRLILSQGAIPNDLNLRHGQRLSALLAGGVVVALAAGTWNHQRLLLWLPLVATLLVGLMLLNLPFYRLVSSLKGPLFAVLVLPLHVLYYLSGGIAFAAGAILHVGRRLRRQEPEPR